MLSIGLFSLGAMLKKVTISYVRWNLSVIRGENNMKRKLWILAFLLVGVGIIGLAFNKFQIGDEGLIRVEKAGLFKAMN